MGNKEYKTSEEVKQRAEEAIGHTFKEIFELARKYQQENGLKEKHGKSSFNKVAHVRNKAGESEYFCENANSVKLKNTAEVITLKEIPAELKDTPIPTGEYMTKQCFWFNKKYMKQQIKDFIKSY